MKDQIKRLVAGQFEGRPLIAVGVVSGVGFIAGLWARGLFG